MSKRMVDGWLDVDDPDYIPACDISGKCEPCDEDELSDVDAAMCMHCGGWRYRNYPFYGNWGIKW